jgi:hypothetical protein
MLDIGFVTKLTDSLLSKEIDRKLYMEDSKFEGIQRLKPEGLRNTLLAVDCFFEASRSSHEDKFGDFLLVKLRQEIQQEETFLSVESVEELLFRIARFYSDELPWLKVQAQEHEDGLIQQVATSAIAENFRWDPSIFEWLKQCTFQGENPNLQFASIYMLGKFYKAEPEIWEIIKTQIQQTRSWLCRFSASNTLSEFYSDKQEAFSLLVKRVKQDDNELVRYSALQGIADNFSLEPQAFELFLSVFNEDPFIQTEKYDKRSPRLVALKALVENYWGTQVRAILEKSAVADLDKHVKQWAQEQREKFTNTNLVD